MPYCHTSFASVKRFSWRVAQTAFQAYATRGARGKFFGTFQQVTCWRPCTHVTLPVTLTKMNLAHHSNAVGTFSKVMRWRTSPSYHGYHNWYCFFREWVTDIWKVWIVDWTVQEVDYMITNQPIRERLTMSSTCIIYNACNLSLCGWWLCWIGISRKRPHFIAHLTMQTSSVLLYYVHGFVSFLDFDIACIFSFGFCLLTFIFKCYKV